MAGIVGDHDIRFAIAVHVGERVREWVGRTRIRRAGSLVESGGLKTNPGRANTKVTKETAKVKNQMGESTALRMTKRSNQQSAISN